ncbi:MAG TPA: DNA polymerase I [Acidimicrobiales bacterium]|nr:DNA polymerase I [Acidimicrobiales bacterium]
MAKLLLLDGNSLTYRAFFALPTDMATASGQVTNAVFGFTSMLINLLKDHKPDAIAVAFDLPQPTFRHELVADYKAGRAETPDILRQQMGLVRQVVEALRIPILELPGFEADDVLATLATQARDRADDVVIVTGDRDVYQLVEDPHVRVLYNLRGVSEYREYDEAGIKDRTGVTPTDYPQYAALRGDPSDNLPGVPGVGEKTAAKLINDYGDLDGIFANLDKLTPKLRENLAAHEAQVRSNFTATPLVRDAPISADVDDLRMGGWDTAEIRDLFNFLEFRTLWDRLVEAVGSDGGGLVPADAAEALAVDVVRVDTAKDAKAFLAGVLKAGDAIAMAGAWEGAEGRSELVGLAIDSAWLPSEVLTGDVLPALQRVVTKVPVNAHNAKALMRALHWLGVDFTSLNLDSAIAAYLIDPAGDEYLLEDLAPRYAGVEVRAPEGPEAGQLDLDGTAGDVAETTVRRAAAVQKLVEPLSAALAARNLSDLYDNIERPLVRVLARMEIAGVQVDAAYLKELNTSLTDEVRKLEGEIQELAGEPFKVNSTPQLRTVLFDKLGLQPTKRTKTGFSTDAQSLEKLLGEHPIIEKLLRYREVEKLRSTYGEGLLGEVGPDGRIHATFNQTVARTGRLSSDAPNLHNIPVRSEEGRRFRRAFVPAKGCQFLVADYNQIELRVIAHLAEDPGLIEAFTSGADIHTTTASRIYSVEPGDVNVAQRSKAKMVSYGLAYGMESYGLAQRLNIPVDEAAEILDAYFVAFPNVKAYMERTVADARQRGYTETLMGRRRQIPELASGNYRIRQAGERQAMNAGIQGLAADIFKVALVRLDEGLEQAKLESRLVLQVHDEVILEVPPAEKDAAAKVTLDAMRGACDLCVDLEVNVSWGDTWAAAKG